MAGKRKILSSGIGGQAVLEGIMMKNKEEYAVAIRKPDGEIEVTVDVFRGILPGRRIKDFPFIRGVFNFIDSMRLGMKTITYSASFYEDAEAEETAFDKAVNKVFKGKAESILMGFTTVISILLAVGIFMLLPFYISSLLKEYIRNESLVLILEGVIRISIFLIYVVAISLMKDIRRLYQYHGAEHKCINCIEKGRPLTVRDVMRSSRLHRRCGTSFMFFVIFVSIIVFFFIRVDHIWLKALVRIALIPVIAGISYELIRLAGRSNNLIVRILSAPGMLIQRLTTREPDEQMAEVAIKAVEAVFDWKAYHKEVFNYDVDESWMREETDDIPEEDEEWDFNDLDLAENEFEEKTGDFYSEAGADIDIESFIAEVDADENEEHDTLYVAEDAAAVGGSSYVDDSTLEENPALCLVESPEAEQDSSYADEAADQVIHALEEEITESPAEESFAGEEKKPIGTDRKKNSSASTKTSRKKRARKKPV